MSTQNAKTNSLGNRIRELRKSKSYTLRHLAPLVGAGFSYLSKVENNRLDFVGSPSVSLIHRLADVLEANEEELLLLGRHVPDSLANRMLEHPETFRVLGNCDQTQFLLIVKTIQRKSSSLNH